MGNEWCSKCIVYLHETHALDSVILVICLARFAFVQFWIDSIFVRRRLANARVLQYIAKWPLPISCEFFFLLQKM